METVNSMPQLTEMLANDARDARVVAEQCRRLAVALAGPMVDGMTAEGVTPSIAANLRDLVYIDLIALAASYDGSAGVMDRIIAHCDEIRRQVRTAQASRNPAAFTVT